MVERGTETAGETEAAGEDAASGGCGRHNWRGIYVYARVAVGDGSELGRGGGSCRRRWVVEWRGRRPARRERIAVVGLGEKIWSDFGRGRRESRGRALLGGAWGGRRCAGCGRSRLRNCGGFRDLGNARRNCTGRRFWRRWNGFGMGRGRGWKSKSFFVALTSGAKAPVFCGGVVLGVKVRT